MSVNISAKMEELFISFLREDSLRRSLDREMGLLRLGAWTAESAVVRPQQLSSMRSPPVARSSSITSSTSNGGARRGQRVAANASRWQDAGVDGALKSEGEGEQHNQHLQQQEQNGAVDTAAVPFAGLRPASPLALAIMARASSTGASPDACSVQAAVEKRAPRASLPRFFPAPGSKEMSSMDRMLLEQVKEAFGDDDLLLRLEDFELIAKVCGLSTYLAADLFHACGGRGEGGISISSFTAFWRQLATDCTTTHEKVMRLLSPRGLKMKPEHLRRMVRFVLDTHPGLEFLLESPQYHERYIDTVIARIFYAVNRSWSGQISLQELRRSDLLDVLQFLDDEPNINKETKYFSYEHFYVIYTCFWKLDKDRDLSIDQAELSRHGDCGLSSLVLDRIFSETVFLQPAKDDQMSYWDFVYFILAEEDKTTPTAIEYWFRIMDLDGDGVLSMYELEQLYELQLVRLEELNMEALPFKDCLCQTLDLVRPRHGSYIELHDLKCCKQASVIINTYANLNKYLDIEEQAQGSSPEDEEEKMSDWQKFAVREYILLSAEEDDDDDDFDEYSDDFPESPMSPH